MKNIKVQEKSGQCGVFALANLFQAPAIIENYGDDEDLCPCGYVETNIILEKEEISARMTHLVFTSHEEFVIEPEFATALIDDYVKGLQMSYGKEDFITPFVMYVQAGDDRYGLHAISLLRYKDEYSYLDPRDEEWITVKSLDEIAGRYRHINRIMCFNSYPEKNGSIMIVNDLFDELLPLFSN